MTEDEKARVMAIMDSMTPNARAEVAAIWECLGVASMARKMTPNDSSAKTLRAMVALASDDTRHALEDILLACGASKV